MRSTVAWPRTRLQHLKINLTQVGCEARWLNHERVSPVAMSSSSSNGSYFDLELRDIMEWQVEITKSFKVAELDELLRKKGKSVKGQKPAKALEVAWLYTREEITKWRRERQNSEPPALLNRSAKTLEHF